MNFFVIFIFFLLSGFCQVGHSAAKVDAAKAETWKIITLEWPPYSGAELPDKGIACKALAQTLKSVGIEVQFVFMPWSRGIYEVRKPGYIGIFPSWTAEGIVGAKLSPSLFQSPIGFAFTKTPPRSWNTLQDLKGLRIGTVQAYRYPQDFVTLGAQGFYKLIPVTMDEQNLYKVAHHRIDATIIDLVNAKFIVQSHGKELKDLISIDPKVFKNADLFITMKGDSQYQEHFDKMKLALEKISMTKLVETAVKESYK